MAHRHIFGRRAIALLLTVLAGRFLSCTGMAPTSDLAIDSGNLVVKNFAVAATQGVAVDSTYFYAISNTRIDKRDKITGALVATWQPDPANPDDAHFHHLNGGTVVGDTLYAAHSRYSSDPNDCTVEIFAVLGATLRHVRTIPMPSENGSLTWIDRRSDGSWWMCFAVYGSPANQNTRLFKYRFTGGSFIEEGRWGFPDTVVSRWGAMSSSGGSWGPDGYLYTTGHEGARAYVLDWSEAEGIRFVRTETHVGFYGQGVAWDRTLEVSHLWGIRKGGGVSETLIAGIVALPRSGF
jgi:hypothetical protein